MGSNNGRPIQGGESAMGAVDWRSHLPPTSRQLILHKITSDLKRSLPVSGEEGLHEADKIAVSLEENIYATATSQSEYLRRISLEMLRREPKFQNCMGNSTTNNLPAFPISQQQQAEKNDKKMNWYKHEGLVLSEKDTIFGMMEGVPAISFSESVQNSMADSMKKCVVVSLLGKTMGYTELYDNIMSMWKPKGGFELIELDNKNYLVRFECEIVFDKCLSGGPWIINGHYLNVQPWDSSLNTRFSRVVVSVRFPGLPIRYYHKSVLRAITRVVGKVVGIEYGESGKFARMAVVVDLSKPLIKNFMLDDRMQGVEYEGLSTICFECGCYGHSRDQCPGKNGANTVKMEDGEPVAKKRQKITKE